MAEAVLRTERLTKHFGGLAAVNDVSLEFFTDQIHAVIGPNGAGKTTLTNLLSGDLPCTSGRIYLDGDDIAGLSPDRISQRGVGRSYQKTNIFLPFTVLENCRIAAQSRLPSSMRFIRSAHAYPDVVLAAKRALAEVGLEHRAQVQAAALSHGEQRQLEIAMTLATRPRILLLDEPLAGMGSEDSTRMVELLRQLKQAHAMLLVEHDMDAVFALADRLTVMVDGRVLESGEPELIRASAAVQEAYLGTEEP
ncbi:MAG: ABC transporter ATP-binding protein [Betaproteobacteria bacterium]|nr:MAG: ABC transporter ATP-binding protein [Betaproteobacteria bacterium]